MMIRDLLNRSFLYFLCLSIVGSMVLFVPLSAQAFITALRGTLPTFANVVREHANEVWYSEEDTDRVISRWDIWGTMSYTQTKVDGDFTVSSGGTSQPLQDAQNISLPANLTFLREEEHEVLHQWVGADFHLTHRIFIGVIGVYERQKSKIVSQNQEYTSDDLGGGATLGVRLTDDFILNASAVALSLSSENDRLDGNRFLATASMTQNIHNPVSLYKFRVDLTGMYGIDMYDDDEDVGHYTHFGRLSMGIEAETQAETLFNVIGGIRFEYDVQNAEYVREQSDTEIIYAAPEEAEGMSVKVGLVGRWGGMTVRVEGGYGDVLLRESYETFYGQASVLLRWNEYFDMSLVQRYQNDNVSWQANVNVSF